MNFNIKKSILLILVLCSGFLLAQNPFNYPDIELSISPSTPSICQGQSNVTVSCDQTFNSYTWFHLSDPNVLSLTGQNVTITDLGKWELLVESNEEGQECIKSIEFDVVGSESCECNMPNVNTVTFSTSRESCSSDLELRVNEVYSKYSWTFNGEQIIGEYGQSIVANVPGIYGVRVTDELCVFEGQYEITEPEILNSIVLNTSNGSLCNSQDVVTISLDGNYSKIEWFDEFGSIGFIGSKTISVSKEGEYRVEAENDSGCPSTGSIKISSVTEDIEIYPKHSIYCGDPITLRVGSINEQRSIQWSNANGPIIGETGQTIEITSAGLYSVVISDDNQCEASHQVLVEDELNVDWDKILLENGFTKRVITIKTISFTGENEGSIDKRLVPNNCELNHEQSSDYTVELPIGVVSLNTFLEEEFQESCDLITGQEGILVDDFCAAGLTLQQFLDKSNNEEGAYLSFIPKGAVDQVTAIYTKDNIKRCLPVITRNNKKFTIDFLNELVCHKLQPSNFKLSEKIIEWNEADGKYATNFFSGTIKLADSKNGSENYYNEVYNPNADHFVGGIMVKNYFVGGVLDLTNPNAIQYVSVNKISFQSNKPRTWIDGGVKFDTPGSYMEIKIPYISGALSGCDNYLSIYMDVNEFGQLGVAEKFNLLFNHPVVLSDRIVSQVELYSGILDLAPGCIFGDNKLCALFNTVEILESTDYSAINNLLRLAKIEDSEKIIKCFHDNHLVDDFYNMSTALVFPQSRLDFLRHLVRHYFKIDPSKFDVVDQESLQAAELNHRLKKLIGSFWGGYKYDYEVTDVQNQGFAYAELLLQRPISNFKKSRGYQVNYFDANSDDSHWSLYPTLIDKYHNHLDEFLPIKFPDQAGSINLPGIYHLYSIESDNLDTRKKLASNTVHAVSLLFGVGQIRAAVIAARFAKVGITLGTAEVATAVANLFLTNSEYCFDSPEFCQEWKKYLQYAENVLLVGAVSDVVGTAIYNRAKTNWDALAIEQRRGVINNIEEAKLVDKITLVRTLEGSTELAARFKVLFGEVDDYARSIGKPNFMDNLVKEGSGLSKVSAYHLLTLETAIKNLDETGELGYRFLDDILQTKGVAGKLGGEVAAIKEGTVKAWETLISHPLIRKDVATLTSASKILDNTGIANIMSKIDLQTTVQKLAEKGVRCRTCASGNPAYRYMDEILDDLEHGATKFGNEYSSVITGFKQGGNFTEGSMFVADAVRRYGNDFPPGTLFEFTEVTVGGVRRVDVRVGNVFYEFKSVASVPPSGFATQFLKDLNLGEVTELNQLKWWFDGNKVSSLPKQQFLDALDNASVPQNIVDNLTAKFGGNSWDDIVDLIDNNFDDIFHVK